MSFTLRRSTGSLLIAFESMNPLLNLMNQVQLGLYTWVGAIVTRGAMNKHKLLDPFLPAFLWNELGSYQAASGWSSSFVNQQYDGELHAGSPNGNSIQFKQMITRKNMSIDEKLFVGVRNHLLWPDIRWKSPTLLFRLKIFSSNKSSGIA
jgi:hypothetical protein